MLSLASETPREWVERAVVAIDEVLLDHAHCEKKAASTAVSLLFRYPEHAALLEPVARLAREELAHFAEVLGHLRARGLELRRQTPSPYAGELLAAIRRDEPARAVDTLLCLALIEARSCERMKLLATALPDASLRGLYAGLLASEARHHQTYVDLAATLAPPAEVRARLRALASHEASVLASAPPMPRLHT